MAEAFKNRLAGISVKPSAKVIFFSEVQFLKLPLPFAVILSLMVSSVIPVPVNAPALSVMPLGSVSVPVRFFTPLKAFSLMAEMV